MPCHWIEVIVPSHLPSNAIGQPRVQAVLPYEPPCSYWFIKVIDDPSRQMGQPWRHGFRTGGLSTSQAVKHRWVGVTAAPFQEVIMDRTGWSF